MTGKANERGPPTDQVEYADVERRWLPLALALGALATAVVGALGPATEVRTTYSWPPAALPGVTPARAWYTPSSRRHRPETIAARIPCMPGSALAERNAANRDRTDHPPTPQRASRSCRKGHNW